MLLKALLAIHLVLAVFAVGPLVHAATTAARGIRTADAGATASAARVLRIYAAVSVLVIIAGFALLPQKRRGEQLGQFSDLWVWLSLVLWVVAMALVFALIVPSLDRATRAITDRQPVATLTPRVAAGGGIVGVIFVVVVVLMVYRPGP